MSKQSPHDTLERLWDLLELLPNSQPGRTANELAEALENNGSAITTRTVERDLVKMAERLWVEHDGARPQRWCKGKPKTLDALGITTSAALTL